ncbi:MAG TPA: efflux RND transporter periplasmic adaptor subunit [Bryobacteraceae bacterium]|nr:efflux RND transporter periplasmic adaptor subunit [Bryobacteraceae bacterium]
MDSELKSLRIDKSKRAEREGSGWATRWILAGVALLVLLGAGRFAYDKVYAATEVTTMRVPTASSAGSGSGESVILNATGYIVAAHKIQVASKVLGRVAWIGVDKGDKVQKGQVIARLEDDEYKANLQQAQGQLQALDARLAELLAGSRPEEIAKSDADLTEAKAELANAKINLDRQQQLAEKGVVARQALDDAKARYEREAARVASIQKTFELTRIGPRKEQIDAVRGQIVEARGRVAFYTTQLENTVIRAPVSGTILEREVEPGEFVTTSFVGERGAKGYVVSLANLNDLEVELDINQNDFAKLGPRQKGIVTTDAYPDRKYEGIIDEISPEANRQKATVQVKVKILAPDEYLRPEMNSSVAFVSEAKETISSAAPARPVVYVPTSAVRNNAVFVIAGDKAMKRTVRTGTVSSQGIRIDSGLNGGEDLVVNPPEELKEGDRVKRKQG